MSSLLIVLYTVRLLVSVSVLGALILLWSALFPAGVRAAQSSLFCPNKEPPSMCVATTSVTEPAYLHAPSYQPADVHPPFDAPSAATSDVEPVSVPIPQSVQTPAPEPISIPLGPQDHPSSIGFTTSCNFWATDESGKWSKAAALADCEQDFAKLQELGIHWVRFGVPWHFLGEAGKPMRPERKAFLQEVLESARNHELSIMYQISLGAPVSAYGCGHPPPTRPSERLDFCDEVFDMHLEELVVLVAPYVRHFELFNEVNWNLNNLYGADFPYSAYGAQSTGGYVAARMKSLHIRAGAIIDRNAPEAVMHGTGISYFCSHREGDCPKDGRVIDAFAYLHWLQYGWQKSTDHNVLHDEIDVVNLHPYFPAKSYSRRIKEFAEVLKGVAPQKRLWLSETGGKSGDDAQIAGAFRQAVLLADEGVIERFFWFTLRDATGNPKVQGHALFGKDWEVLKPQLLEAVVEGIASEHKT